MTRNSLVALVLLAATTIQAPLQAADPTPTLTVDQRRQVTDLLNVFRRSKAEPDKRAEAVSGILAIGGPAPAQLLSLIHKELVPLQTRYRADFFKAAKDLLRSRFSDRDPQEIDSLRGTVLALGRKADLSKEEIVAKGDPAMAKLHELLWIDPKEVLDSAPALKTRRDELVELGRHWFPAADYVAKHGPRREGGPEEAPSFENVLGADEMLATTLTLATGDSDREALIANVALEPQIDFEEANGIRDLNRMRLLLGLKPLRIDVKLCEAGRDHSKDMVEKKFFSHDSPVPGKATPWDRAKRFGTTAHAENIAAGARTGPQTNLQWLHSPGHHKNMLGNHSRIGLGRYENTWTEMFG